MPAKFWGALPIPRGAARAAAGIGIVLLVASFVLLFLVGHFPRRVKSGVGRIEGTKDKSALDNQKALPTINDLCADLEGGPLRIVPAGDTKGLMPAEAVVASAEAYLGIGEKPSQTWLIVITDAEYPQDQLKERRCWLLEYRDVLRWVSESQKVSGAREKTGTFYAVMDGAKGYLWSVFTDPKVAWWKRVAYKDSDVAKRYQEMGRTVVPARIKPAHALLPCLNVCFGDDKSFAYSFFSADQIIIRYWLYTDKTRGTLVRRVGGAEIVPQLVDETVWCVGAEGLKAPFTGSIPHVLGETKPAKMPTMEEKKAVISARTGKLLFVEQYR